MKTIVSSVLVALMGVGIAMLVFGVWGAINDEKCEEGYDQMEAVFKCMQTPACLVFAEDMLKGKEAARYYERNCHRYEQERSAKEVVKPKPEGSTVPHEDIVT
jgi:hypothetical protein